MIDELELVRSFRANQPPPDEAATAAARAALERRFAPRPQRPRRTWRPRALVAIPAACAAIAGGLLAGSVTGSSSATAAALYRLAGVALSHRWTSPPGPGQYLYTPSVGLTAVYTGAPGGRECEIVQTERREIWIAANGAGALRTANTDGRFTSAADRAVCARAHITDPGSLDSRSAQRFHPGGLGFPSTDWRSLSTNPARLLVQLRRLDGGPPTAAEDFVHIGDYLRESDTPPAIRAALYRAAALIPGVQLLGVRDDPAGRPGLAVVFVYHGQPAAELIFDQRTARLLAEETLGPGARPTTWTAYLESRIVTRTPAFPFAPGG